VIYALEFNLTYRLLIPMIHLSDHNQNNRQSYYKNDKHRYGKNRLIA